MNTYDDDLHKDVAGILSDEQSMLQNQANDKKCASLGYYFAQGERDRCEERLVRHKKIAKVKGLVKSLAVGYSTRTTNIVAASVQANGDTQSVTKNAATAAANVQYAANAIVRLAGDVGNALSILNAADRESDLYIQAKGAGKFIDDVAVLAEQTSDTAMNFSKKVSETMSADVLKMSQACDTDIKNQLIVTSKQFDDISTLIVQDNQNWASSKVAVSGAYRVLAGASVEYTATKHAFTMCNVQLNMNLEANQGISQNGKTFNVSFNAYQPPFEVASIDKNDDKTKIPSASIDAYYIMIAKESKAGLFSLANAEAFLAAKTSSRYFKLNPGEIAYNTEFLVHDKAVKEMPEKSHQIFDTDGDPIVKGQSYCAFVIVTFTNEYKKLLDNFNDFISAPSTPFIITRRIAAPFLSQAVIDDNRKQKLPQIVKDWEIREATKSNHFADIEFTEPAENEGIQKVQYRCILLKEKDSRFAIYSDDHTTARKAEKAKDIVLDPTTQATFISGLDIIKDKTNVDLEVLSDNIDFVFSDYLASQVSKGNYSPFTVDHKDSKKYKVTFAADTLDNFGNAIIPNQKYIPAVYATYDGEVSAQSKYKGSLSNWQFTEPIVIQFKN